MPNQSERSNEEGVLVIFQWKRSPWVPWRASSRDSCDGAVLERLEALERENAAWRTEAASLARNLEKLMASAPPARHRDDDAGQGDLGQGDLGQDSRVSRRGMMRLGAAAVGAGAATVGALVGASPALAGTDGDLTLDSVSNASSSPTGLAVNGNSSAYGIGVTDNGLAAYPPGFHGRGILERPRWTVLRRRGTASAGAWWHAAGLRSDRRSIRRLRRTPALLQERRHHRQLDTTRLNQAT
jgi:hypothetical protein